MCTLSRASAVLFPCCVVLCFFIFYLHERRRRAAELFAQLQKVTQVRLRMRGKKSEDETFRTLVHTLKTTRVLKPEVNVTNLVQDVPHDLDVHLVQVLAADALAEVRRQRRVHEHESIQLPAERKKKKNISRFSRQHMCHKGGDTMRRAERRG